MAQSFLEVARGLVEDPAAKAAYADDPAGFLAARGFAGLGPEDVEDAVGLVADALPAPLALQLAADPEDGTGDGLLARLAALEPEAATAEPSAPAGVDVASLPDPTGPLDLGGARATAVSGGSVAAATTEAVTEPGASDAVDADVAAGEPSEAAAPDDLSPEGFGTGAPATEADAVAAGDETDEAASTESDDAELVRTDTTGNPTPPELDEPSTAAELPQTPEPPPPDEPDEIEEMI